MTGRDIIASCLAMIALFLALAVVGNDTASLGTLLLLLMAFFVAIFAAFLVKFA